MHDAHPEPRRTLDVRHIDKDDAKAIILPNHYSGTWNSAFGLVNFGIFDGDELCGAAVFGHLMNPASTYSIADLPPSAVLELNRLWVDDRFGKNTETAMLAKCWKWFRANTTVELIQSFADGRLGVGTIYKAANFGYYGATRTQFFQHRDTGETFHAALTNDSRHLSAMLRTNEWIIDGQAEAFAVRTYRYLYPLTKRARRAIKLEREPYPPYSKGVIAMPGWRVPLSQVARCYVVAEAKGDPRARKFIDYLNANAPAEEVMRLIDEADANPFVAAIVAEAENQPSLFGVGGAA